MNIYLFPQYVPVYKGRGRVKDDAGPFHAGGVLRRGGEPAVQGGAPVQLSSAAGRPQEGVAGATRRRTHPRAAAAVHCQDLDRRQGGHLQQGRRSHHADQESDECHRQSRLHLLHVRNKSEYTFIFFAMPLRDAKKFQFYPNKFHCNLTLLIKYFLFSL